MTRIKKIIGESIWQAGLPVVSFKLNLNPFTKALSTTTITTATLDETFEDNQSIKTLPNLSLKPSKPAPSAIIEPPKKSLLYLINKLKQTKVSGIKIYSSPQN